LSEAYWAENSRRNTTGWSLAGDEPLPGFCTLMDHVHGVLLVLALAGEGELVLWLSVGDLVNTEPLVGGTQEAGQVTLDILDIIELGGEGVVDVNDNDLPVGLLLVQQGHDTQNLDLLDLAGVANELTNLADVERVVVTLGLSLGVDDIGVLPGLNGVLSGHGGGVVRRLGGRGDRKKGGGYWAAD
jgi:hypothetical protein